jgi:beta-glucosidase
VPVYVHQPVSDILVPDRRLVGFARVQLRAGGSRTVRVVFPVSALAVTPGDIQSAGRPRVEPGAYQVQVENLTADFSING